MKKKLLSLMVVMSLVVSMTLGVTGCGSKSSDSDKKVLKVAFECAYAPYNWTQESPEVGNGKQAVKIKNADGYAYGYEVELAQRIVPVAFVKPKARIQYLRDLTILLPIPNKSVASFLVKTSELLGNIINALLIHPSRKGNFSCPCNFILTFLVAISCPLYS